MTLTLTNSGETQSIGITQQEGTQGVTVSQGDGAQALAVSQVEEVQTLAVEQADSTQAISVEQTEEVQEIPVSPDVRFLRGENGATFTPHVDEDGNLSWTNDGGLENPEAVNVRGPQGDGYVLTEADKAAIAGLVPVPDFTETDPTVPDWAKAEAKPSYTADEVGADSKGSADSALAQAKAYADAQIAAIPAPDVSGQINAHNVSADAHNDVRLLLAELDARLTALADSDDDTLDQLSEVVAYIKANRELIESVTTAKVSVSDIIDNLTTNVGNKPLSAAQGVVLKALIDAITVPVKVSELENDSGYLTEHQDISGKVDKSALLNLIFPVGSICTTSSNAAPAIGGTWELVGKGFIEAQGSGTTDLITYDTTNTTSCTVYYRRSGNTMRLRFALKIAVAAAETNLTFGTLVLSKLGVANIGSIAYTSIPFGGENGIVLCSLSTAGKLTHTDVVVKGNTTTVAAASTVYGDVTLTLRAEDMLDSFCDKFHWKRTV